MKKLVWLFGCLACIVLFVRCDDVEFSPNEPWQEQMMIYGILDQDDDTTFVRIEKVFLGDGNALHYAKQKDSVYYPVDDLDVKMYEYNLNDTNNSINVFQFDYTMRQKPEGSFYSGEVPLYYCVTKNKLSVNKFYRLEVTNKKTGFKASSSTYLIADYSINTSNFTFNNSSGTRLVVTWNNVNESQSNANLVAKRFQVNVRFNYRRQARIEHVDIPLSAVSNSSTSIRQMTAPISKEDIVLYLKNALENETGISWYNDAPFEINILACDQEMFDYISINNATERSLNYKPSYSNINGGYGLFASRRTHISKSYNTYQVDQDLQVKLNSVITFN
ncbi:MAG: hypothetical protein IJ180_04560 [Bacteroidales bacterium]|nr:hypothetical protein [Bacteroidales bacterium]